MLRKDYFVSVRWLNFGCAFDNNETYTASRLNLLFLSQALSTFLLSVSSEKIRKQPKLDKNGDIVFIT